MFKRIVKTLLAERQFGFNIDTFIAVVWLHKDSYNL